MSHAKERLSLDVTKETKALVARVMKKSNSTTYVEAIRRSLAAYEFLLEAKEVWVKDSEGGETRLKFL